MSISKEKLTNPKQFAGSAKIPFHLWPETASLLGSLALLDGALKYGRSNWRPAGVQASVYYDAARRHMNRWFEGQDFDPDSGLHHFAHALACMAILADAWAAGVLNDDRMVAGGYLKLIEEMTSEVDRLKALHAGKNPRHYTIADSGAKAKGDPKVFTQLDADAATCCGGMQFCCDEQAQKGG